MFGVLEIYNFDNRGKNHNHQYFRSLFERLISSILTMSQNWPIFFSLSSSFSNSHLGGHPVLWILELGHKSRDSTHLKWQFWWFYLPYTLHYNPRFVFFLAHFWRPKTFILGAFFCKILTLCTISIQDWAGYYGVRTVFQMTFFLQKKSSSLFEKSYHMNQVNKLTWTVYDKLFQKTNHHFYVHFFSYLKCSNWHWKLKLLLNFCCLSTFC